MKCPKCVANHKASEGMVCRCGYKFCFSPKSDGLTDGKFLAAVRLASQNDTSYFTPNQLHAAYCQVAYPKWWKTVGLMVGMALALGLAIVESSIFFIALLFLIGWWWASRSDVIRNANLVFSHYIKKWLRAGNLLERMIEKPQLHQPPPEWPEKDIYDYGVERLLIVDRDEMVDLLVRNDLHASERALILSRSGYPMYLQPQAVRAIKANPKLPVFLLHDATHAGERMKQAVRNLPWLPVDEHPIVDLGFSAKDIRQMKPLKAMQRRKQKDDFPLDYLLYGTLAVGMSQAFADSAPLSTVLSDVSAGTLNLDFG